MAYSPRIKAITPRGRRAAYQDGPGRLEVDVRLESGPNARIAIETPDRVAARVASGKRGYAFGAPVLFVLRLDQGTIEAALSAMAEELSGYWLRFYDR